MAPGLGGMASTHANNLCILRFFTSNEKKKPYICTWLFTINSRQLIHFKCSMQNTANLQTLYIHSLWEENRGFYTINYRFLTSETNLKALYILLFVHNLISKAICSNSTDFCLQIFVYKCLFLKKEKITLTTPFTF